MWLACHGGHLETVQILVKHEADPDAQDNRRVSPLIIAFRKGHLKVLIFLWILSNLSCAQWTAVKIVNSKYAVWFLKQAACWILGFW